VWVFFFPCGYGVLEFLDFESQVNCCGRRVWAGVFLVVCSFCGVCARLFVNVDGKGEVLQRQCRAVQFVLICRLRLLAFEEFVVLCYLVVPEAVGEWLRL